MLELQQFVLYKFRVDKHREHLGASSHSVPLPINQSFTLPDPREPPDPALAEAITKYTIAAKTTRAITKPGFRLKKFSVAFSPISLTA